MEARLPALSAAVLLISLARLLPSAATPGVASLEHALSLSRQWEAVYGLSPESPTPPANLSFPAHVPPAPHLDDCANRTQWRWRVEQRGADSAPPDWTNPSACCGCAPQPPWTLTHA
ncbi:hypothetical protein CLOM_g20811 [Closterium sp. NIES-68]|nr:hypothetical protein CLOM_g20811 [Closterium sp. NIES-68]